MDADPLQSVRHGPPPSANAAALSDGFEDISLDDGGAKAANAKAAGVTEAISDSDQPPKAPQRIVLFSGASSGQRLSLRCFPQSRTPPARAAVSCHVQ